MESVGPLNPTDYRARTDPSYAQLQEYATQAAGVDDPEWHQTRIHELLARFPLRQLTAHLDSEGATVHLGEVLRPLVDEQVRAYLAQMDMPGDAFPVLSEEVSLAFQMQWSGDRLTGEHSVNAAVMTGFVSDAVNVRLEPAPKDPREKLVLAGAVHDLGKAELPRFLLESPIPRVLQPALFGWDLGDPKRKRKLKSPIPLNETERLRFQPLLDGERFDSEEILAFGRMCKERKGDYRDHITMRTLIRLSEYVLEHSKLPDALQAYVDELFDPEDHACLEHMMKIMREQGPLIQDANWALARASLDGHQTLMESLATHEIQSFFMAPGCVAGLVAKHHNFPATQDALLRSGFNAPVDPISVHALIMGDIISALGEHRPYFRDGQPKSVAVIRRILIQEGEKHGIPMELMKSVTDLLLNGEEEREPLRKIFANGNALVS